MDPNPNPNTVVLEISSDEEVGWTGHGIRGIPDGGDDHNNWIAELLGEVNRDNCGYDDDSDEVVVVSEVFPKRNPRKKLTSKATVIDFDDDCVVLDHDPDKPIRNDNDAHEDGDDDSDDLIVVGEKGQVACRDYPHPRHLCIKFPFSSTPNQTHCGQCYCYVCDSLAPCVYWGNGSASVDHCHATDKDEFWKLERLNVKTGSKAVQPNLDPLVQTPIAAHSPVIRPVSSNYGVPSIVSRNRTPFLLSRSKYQPGLLSQQLTRTSNWTQRGQGQHNYNLSTPFHGPVFKRTGSSAVLPAANRNPYSSYRDNYGNAPQPSDGNLCRQQDYLVNEMLSGGSSQPEFSHQPSSNTRFDFSSSFEPQVNPDSFAETPVVLQPHPIPLPSLPQGQSCLPIYSEAPVDTLHLPSPKYDMSWPQNRTTNETFSASSLEAPVDSRHLTSWPQNRTTRETFTPSSLPEAPVHPRHLSNWSETQTFAPCSLPEAPVDLRHLSSLKYFENSWPESQTNHQPGTRSSLPEVTTQINESSPATTVGRGVVDYEYDNWTFGNQVYEPESTEVHGAFGLSEFSPEPPFVDTENGNGR